MIDMFNAFLWRKLVQRGAALYFSWRFSHKKATPGVVHSLLLVAKRQQRADSFHPLVFDFRIDCRTTEVWAPQANLLPSRKRSAFAATSDLKSCPDYAST